MPLPWIKADPAIVHHQKTKRLTLQIARVYPHSPSQLIARGVLLSLQSFSGLHAPDGVLASDDETWAVILELPEGEATQIRDALVRVGFLDVLPDGSLFYHGWDEWQEAHVLERQREAERARRRRQSQPVPTGRPQDGRSTSAGRTPFVRRSPGVRTQDARRQDGDGDGEETHPPLPPEAAEVGGDPRPGEAEGAGALTRPRCGGSLISETYDDQPPPRSSPDGTGAGATRRRRAASERDPPYADLPKPAQTALDPPSHGPTPPVCPDRAATDAPPSAAPEPRSRSPAPRPGHAPSATPGRAEVAATVGPEEPRPGTRSSGRPQPAPLPTSAASGPPYAEIQALWAHWVAATGRPNAKCTRARLRRVSAMVERHGLEAGRRIVSHVAASKHHRGRFDWWETAPLKDPESCERWIDPPAASSNGKRGATDEEIEHLLAEHAAKHAGASHGS